MKKVLIFVGGAVVGSAVSAIVLKKHYQKQLDGQVEEIHEIYEKQLDDILVDLPEDFRNAHGFYTVKDPEAEVVVSEKVMDQKELLLMAMDEDQPGYFVTEENEDATTYVNRMLSIKGSFHKEDIHTFTRWWQYHTAHELDREEFVNTFEEHDDIDPGEEINGPKGLKPHELQVLETIMDGVQVITYEEFADSDKEYDSDEVIYYELDNVMTDSDNVPIPEDFNTGRALSYFGTFSHDPNKVYIRNHNIGCDFEITRELGMTSTEAIYGISEE